MPFLTCINDEKQKKIIINRCCMQRLHAQQNRFENKIQGFLFQALKEEIDAMDRLPVQQK